MLSRSGRFSIPRDRPSVDDQRLRRGSPSLGASRTRSAAQDPVPAARASRVIARGLRPAGPGGRAAGDRRPGAGVRGVPFDGSGRSAGIYLYRLARGSGERRRAGALERKDDARAVSGPRASAPLRDARRARPGAEPTPAGVSGSGGLRSASASPRACARGASSGRHHRQDHGRVLDDKQQAAPRGDGRDRGPALGAFTDADGRYKILNVPAGTYVGPGDPASATAAGRRERRRLRRPDHASTRAQGDGARDRGDRGERQRPVVDVNLTSTRSSLSSEEIEELPVQELQDVVNLQAGVVDGHFRGGRLGEVQYQVDGVTVNNAYDNTSSCARPLAARGGAGDQRHLRRRVRPGDERRGERGAEARHRALPVGREVFSGGFAFPGNETPGRRLRVRIRASIQNYQLDPERPARLPQTAILLSGGAMRFEATYVLRRRWRFVPTDVATSSTKVWIGPPATARRCRSATPTNGRVLAKLTTLLRSRDRS